MSNLAKLSLDLNLIKLIFSFKICINVQLQVLTQPHTCNKFWEWEEKRRMMVKPNVRLKLKPKLRLNVKQRRSPKERKKRPPRGRSSNRLRRKKKEEPKKKLLDKQQRKKRDRNPNRRNSEQGMWVSLNKERERRRHLKPRLKILIL